MRTRNGLNNMTRISTGESVDTYDIKTKIIQYILFAIQKYATTHPINHCFKGKKKAVLKKETTHLKKTGRRKAKSDS